MGINVVRLMFCTHSLTLEVAHLISAHGVSWLVGRLQWTSWLVCTNTHSQERNVNLSGAYMYRVTSLQSHLVEKLNTVVSKEL